MVGGRFTLGDRLGAKTVDCRVRGCKRTWLDFSANPALGVGAGGDDTQGLCEPCRKKIGTLADRTLPCSRTGCTGTVAWSREQQLEAFAQNRPAPRKLCDDCTKRLEGLEPKEVPCAVPGCEHTATLSPMQQLIEAARATDASTAETPGDAAEATTGAVAAEEPAATTEERKSLHFDGPMCPRCADVVPRLRDREVPCGINQCKRNWTWSAEEQLAAMVAGKPPQPPRRMCQPCRDSFGQLTDREVRCRASGCKNHWTWTREDQLDAATADKPPAKPPAHLCERCFKVWSELKDTERPCRQPGCALTWTDKRGAQLARILRGKTGDPYPQYCAQHAQQVEQLQDREIPCKTEGCDKTWTWTRAQQLAAGVRPELPVPEDHKGNGATPPGAAAASETGDAAETIAPPDHDGHGDEAAPESGPPAEETSAGEANAEAAALDGDAPTAAGESPAPAGESPAAAGGTPAQSKPGRRRRRKKRRQIQPPSRHCGRCAEFLSTHKTIELPCSQCATPIFWPPESQLQTELGNWEMPKLCGACKRDATEAARQRAREELRQQAGHATGATPEATSGETPSTAETAVEDPPAS